MIMYLSWDLVDIMWWLDNWGVMDTLLPFLLIFIFVYAPLSNKKIFGEHKGFIEASPQRIGLDKG